MKAINTTELTQIVGGEGGERGRIIVHGSLSRWGGRSGAPNFSAGAE